MRHFLLIIAVVAMVGCGGGKQEETQGRSQPEPATPPQATEKPKPPKVGPTKLIAEAPDVVDRDQLERRDGLGYFEGKPFTGVAVDKYPNRQKMVEYTYKDGKAHGLWTTWHSNGQKESEDTYKDGEPDGLWTKWWENGQKHIEVTWKDGRKISFKYWDEDGNPK